MTSTSTWCRACGSPRGPGELLLAIWPDGRRTTVCRPGIPGRSRCIAATAGARICLLDPEAADAFDHATTVPAARP